MRIHFGSFVALAVVLAGCSGQTADSAPSSAPAAANDGAGGEVDESVFEEDAADHTAMTELAESIPPIALKSVEPAETAQFAAQELAKLAAENKVKDGALGQIVEKAVKTGTIKLKKLRKKNREIMGPAIEKFVGSVDGLKASPQTFADARAEFDRIEAEAERLEAAISGRTESILEGTNEQAKARAQADRDRAEEIRGVATKNLGVGRALIDEWDGHAKNLASAFDIELTPVATAEDDIAAAGTSDAEDEAKPEDAAAADK